MIFPSQNTWQGTIPPPKKAEINHLNSPKLIGSLPPSKSQCLQISVLRFPRNFLLIYIYISSKRWAGLKKPTRGLVTSMVSVSVRCRGGSDRSRRIAIALVEGGRGVKPRDSADFTVVKRGFEGRKVKLRWEC